ncbi:hypothetical protein Pcinc_037913 [Petrolisthes cinctipes]|uniref:Uncharacterized protein n=1 Tax=Petrolisthes cinctipes TaxID=88211 RepID=A0AAE1EL05_PETCI|nr:hypothetical protein Pcinc_037913 [Petrolisthes cinctipes]
MSDFATDDDDDDDDSERRRVAAEVLRDCSSSCGKVHLKIIHSRPFPLDLERCDVIPHCSTYYNSNPCTGTSKSSARCNLCVIQKVKEDRWDIGKLCETMVCMSKVGSVSREVL